MRDFARRRDKRFFFGSETFVTFLKLRNRDLNESVLKNNTARPVKFDVNVARSII